MTFGKNAWVDLSGLRTVGKISFNPLYVCKRVKQRYRLIIGVSISNNQWSKYQIFRQWLDMWYITLCLQITLASRILQKPFLVLVYSLLHWNCINGWKVKNLTHSNYDYDSKSDANKEISKTKLSFNVTGGSEHSSNKSVRVYQAILGL